MPSPEELAREKIDKFLADCGWILQNRSTINLSGSRGVAIREALLKRRDEVDRANLGDQTLKDWSSSDKTLSEGKARRVSAGSANQFQQFVTPDDGRKFTELYNVQHLQSAQLDRVSPVCISTIQRLYSMLRGFVFVFWKMFTARRDQQEEKVSALGKWHKARHRVAQGSQGLPFACGFPTRILSHP
jgi:hypothetical protein